MAHARLAFGIVFTLASSCNEPAPDAVADTPSAKSASTAASSPAPFRLEVLDTAHGGQSKIAQLLLEEANAAGGLWGRALEFRSREIEDSTDLEEALASAAARSDIVVGCAAVTCAELVAPSGVAFLAVAPSQGRSSALLDAGPLPNQRELAIARMLIAERPEVLHVVADRAHESRARALLSMLDQASQQQIAVTASTGVDGVGFQREVRALAAAQRKAVLFTMLRPDAVLALAKELRHQEVQLGESVRVVHFGDLGTVATETALSGHEFVSSMPPVRVNAGVRSLATRLERLAASSPLGEAEMATYRALLGWLTAASVADSPQAVAEHLSTVSIQDPSGLPLRFDPSSRHLSLPVWLLSASDGGSATVVWSSSHAVPPQLTATLDGTGPRPRSRNHRSGG